MPLKIRDPFRIDREELMPTLVDDLVYLAQRSICRVRNLFGGTSPVSELDINNGIGELIIELRRNMTNLGAVYRLRRTLSLHTDLSSSETYRKAVKSKFLQLLKAGHAHTAHEFCEEFKEGIDFNEEIGEGFLHLCTQPMPTVFVTRVQGDDKTEEPLPPEHSNTFYALRVCKTFRGRVDFQPLCEEAIARLLQEGKRDDALTLYNTFKNRVRLSSFEQ